MSQKPATEENKSQPPAPPQIEDKAPKTQEWGDINPETIQESVGILKTFVFSKMVKEGDYLDCFDRENQWRMGLIVSMKSDNAYVTFDGWSTKWDEVRKKD